MHGCPLCGPIKTPGKEFVSAITQDGVKDDWEPPLFGHGDFVVGLITIVTLGCGHDGFVGPCAVGISDEACSCWGCKLDSGCGWDSLSNWSWLV